MGRIRTIKPEFFLHEGLYDLEEETSLPVRIAFAGLWTQADREGRFKWRPRQLKTQILPYDDVDFSRVLDALLTRGFIGKYAVEGYEYGYVPGFLDHQVINNRERDSSLPEPNEINELARESRVGHATGACTSGREGKGRGGKGTDLNPMSEADASDQQDESDDSADKPQDHKHTPDDYRLAEWMAERVLKVAPKSKPPKLEAWADTVRLMRERDNHSHRDIAAVFSFANNDQFWSVNILSPTKLREKFGDLDAKMRRASNEKPNYSGGGAAAPKQTAAQRIAAKRQQLAAQSPDMGVVATDDGDVWPPLEQSAGRGTKRYLASGNS